MIYNFDTENEDLALASLLVYAIYQSRDKNKFKVTPDMWGIIERQVKSSSKRAITILDFLEKFKSKIKCSTIAPRYMRTSSNAEVLVPDGHGGFISRREEKINSFWTQEIEKADDKKVLNELYKHTNFVILLVRERLEREKILREFGKLEEEDDE